MQRRSRSSAQTSAERWPTALIDDGAELAESLLTLMRDVGAPSTISEVGYEKEDIPAIVEGALKQQRLLVNAPKPVDDLSLEAILSDSL